MNTNLQIVRRPPAEPVNLDRLARMWPDELQRLHRKIFASDVPSGNSEQARRKIARYVQAEKEGGLPMSARQHALAIARESDVRIRAGMTRTHRRDQLQHATVTGLVSDHDQRVPMPGSVIVKDYRGRRILVRVLDSGFDFEGRRFTSLSAIAKEITGTKWNGLLFFGLTNGRQRGR